jgi:trimethylamine--corrinoid protein Co-methyltransferase
MISDWRNYETWREAGAPTAYDTAQRIYKERLQNYSPPPIESDRREALEGFVARRKAEGGVPTDF